MHYLRIENDKGHALIRDKLLRKDEVYRIIK
jgi:hypothetical protein